MGRLVAASTVNEWAGEAYTRQQIRDKLTLWREHLLEHKHGTANSCLTRPEITRALDQWLDESLHLRGR